MTKAQIIEILQKKVDYIEGITFDELADEILALRVEMPSDGVIEKEAEEHAKFRGFDKSINYNIAKQVSFEQGAKWMKDEIIKRNK